MSSPRTRSLSSSTTTGGGISNEAGAKIIRWGVAAIALVVCARQGLLAFSASVNISLSDGLLLMDMDDSLPTTKSCNNTPIAGSLLAASSEQQQREKEIQKSTTIRRTSASSSSAAVAKIDVDEEEQDDETSSTSSSSCTDYLAYPVPDHQSGLPYLADVFATRDRQYLLFIGLNRGICSEEFEKQDAWMDGEYRFMCIFPDKTAVISEFVAPTGKIYRNNYMFRCKIPMEFQHLVVPGQSSTKLHVDLHSLHNPEAPKKGMNKVPWFESQKITDTPKIDQIPVCHAGYADLNKQYDLVAYTRVQSTYKTQVDKFGKSEQRSTIHRIEEWIDWHVSQGFDHFIIYDNDQTPHGPIEELTKPHVESGLVTYRWFPLKDCVVQNDGPTKKAKRKTFGKRAGNIKRFGQAAGGLSAMHRLDETGALYFAHMDVDEFFVMFEDGATVLDYIKKELTPESKKDVFLWKPTVLDYCDGTDVQSDTDSPMETKQCWTKNHASDQKLIMRTETMLHFQVHFPLTTKKWMKPKAFLVPTDPKKEDGVGFLAHYRGEISPGCKNTDKTDRLPYFDQFLADRRKRKGLPPLQQVQCTPKQQGDGEGAKEAPGESNNGEEEEAKEEEGEEEGKEVEDAGEEEAEEEDATEGGEEEDKTEGEEEEEEEEATGEGEEDDVAEEAEQ